MTGKAVSLNTVLEYIDQLDIEDQQYLQEVIHRRIIDSKRAALVQRSKQAKDNERKGRCKTGTAHDLPADLNG